MKKTPRPHQATAIKQITKTLQTHDRTHVLMACGTGKTTTALWVAEKMQSKTIVVFVPSLSLINQFMKEWLAQNSWDALSTLVICSDDTVTDGMESESILDEEITFPVTNDPVVIAKFLKNCKKSTGTNVIFCTYHSSWILCDAAHGFKLDLGIFDEAHKTAGYDKVAFGMALSDDNVKIKKRLFMTATPRHAGVKNSKEGGHVLLYSMDDETIYGPRAYTLDFRRAINLGLICDYKIIISVATYDAGHMFDKDHQDMEKLVSLQKAIKQVHAKKIITFHSTIYDAGHFSALLQQQKVHPNIKHISSELNVGERSEIMRTFRESDKSLITNARCLTEGVDVPTVDMVAFLNPKSSKIDIVQAIGRALRTAPNKKLGYIFLPLLVPTGFDVDGWVPTTQFKTIWEVLNALMEQDADLADAVKYIGHSGSETELGGTDTTWRGLETFIDTNISESLKKLIKAHVLDKLIDNWDLRYDELIEFKDKYGHTKVPVKDEYIKLGAWCKSQRGHKDTMGRNHFKLLEKIGFDWGNKVPRNFTWDERYQQLVDFKKQHGHLRVPGRRTDTASLSNWVEGQKIKIRTNKLATDKLKLLTKLGLSAAKQEELLQKTWNQRLNELKNYKKNFGHINISQHDPIFKALGKWCCGQRDEYKAGALDAHRYEKLHGIGFDFDPLMSKWQSMLEEYKAAPQPLHSERLRTWCSYQREQFRLGKLDANKVKLLEEAEFDFNPQGQFRYELTPLNEHPMYTNLINYYKKNKTWVARKHSDIANFTKKIRAAYKANKLHKKSIKMLEKLNFTWYPEANIGQRSYMPDIRNELQECA